MGLSSSVRRFLQGLGAFRPQVWPTVGAVFSVGVLLSLCVWQVQRDRFKNRFLDGARTAAALPALDGEAVLVTPEEAYFREVRLRGRFVEPVMLEGGRKVGGAVAYGVLQPFVTEGGTRVLVDRGELARGLLEDGLAALDGGEERALEGQVRPLPESRDKPPITSEHLPPIWGWKHIGAMHAWVGDLAPGFYVRVGPRLAAGDEARPDPYLAGGYGPPARNNTSAHYAVQWLALAGIVSLLWGWASFENNQRRH